MGKGRWAGRFLVFWAVFLFCGYCWVWFVQFLERLAEMDAWLRFGIISTAGVVLAAIFTMHYFGGKDEEGRVRR